MQEPTSSPSSSVRRLGVIDYLIFLAEHAKWLVILPVFAGFVAYGIIQLRPKVYVSTALLLLPQDAQVTPAQAASMMRSDVVIDHARDATAAGGKVSPFGVTTSVGKEGLVRLDVEAANSATAESSAQAVLNEWLKTTAPGDRDRADLVARAARARSDLANVQAAVDAVIKGLATGERPGAEGMLRLAALSETADRLFLVVLQVGRRIDGLSADVIKQAPTRPAAPQPARAAVAAIKAAIATFAVLAAALLALRRLLELRHDPIYGPQLQRLRHAFGRSRSGAPGHD